MFAQTEMTTTDLVARCRRGDAHAWQMLVDRYARLVHAVALRHGLRGGEVDDIGQEVFLSLARTLHEIDDPERLPGWLATTTRRASWRAVQMRRREDELDEVGQEAATAHEGALTSAPMPSLQQMLDTWQRQDALQRAFALLQARCRELLTMLFLDDSEPSYDQISAQLQLPKGSIGPTRTRCLQKMREALETLGHDRNALL